MIITYYEESDILHIQFTNLPVAKSKTVGGNLTVMDLAEDGSPVGLEIIHAASRGINLKSIEMTTVSDDITASRQAANPKPEETAAG